MRILSYFIKTFKENLRDWKILLLVVVFAPMFVYMFYGYYSGSGGQTYTAAVINLDPYGKYSQELIGSWSSVTNSQGKSVLQVVQVADAESGLKMIKNKTADLMSTIPSNFSLLLNRRIKTGKGPIPELISAGDPSSTKYMTAASLCDYAAFSWIGFLTGTETPLSIRFENAGSAKSDREFDLFFPALLVFSIIMLLFTAAATLVREVEKGTVSRLILSRLSAFEFLTAVTFNQLIIGFVCLFATYLAGLSVGYSSNGSPALLLLTGVLTSLSVIAMSIITACFIKTMFGLLTVGCFPFFILMFFSDCLMPLPRIKLFQAGENFFYLNDILPTATATRAFNKILNFNATFSDISFELLCILILTVIYFTIGAILFQKKHLSADKG